MDLAINPQVGAEKYISNFPLDYIVLYQNINPANLGLIYGSDQCK